mgnify:CR=1 FL=1
MILFLSFDGVLHSAGQTQQHFDRLPLLENWLRTHDEIQLVISSKWRKKMPFEDICHIFSDDIRHRVIGMTPLIADETHDEYWRLSEIFDWLNHCSADVPWLVLDDGVFPQAFKRLVWCDPEKGLTSDELQKLSQMKSSMVREMSACRLN